MPGGNVVHFGGIRIRVVGSGNLLMTLFGLNDIWQQPLTALVMSSTNAIEPFKLANFKSQRARLKIETTVINEVFNVNNITIFAKQIWSQYVGQ